MMVLRIMYAARPVFGFAALPQPYNYSNHLCVWRWRPGSTSQQSNHGMSAALQWGPAALAQGSGDLPCDIYACAGGGPAVPAQTGNHGMGILALLRDCKACDVAIVIRCAPTNTLCWYEWPHVYYE